MAVARMADPTVAAAVVVAPTQTTGLTGGVNEQGLSASEAGSIHSDHIDPTSVN